MTTIPSNNTNSINSAVSSLPQPPRNPLGSLIGQIAATDNIESSFYQEEQITALRKNGVLRLINSYLFPINSASSSLVCKDKAATSGLLKIASIPQIHHRLFLNPRHGNWTPLKGTWPAIHTFAAKHSYNVVCKSKDGGGGKEVFRVTNGRELDSTVGKLFGLSKDVVICGYKPAAHEYRVLILNDQVELILKKMLPSVVGDGKKTISELIHLFFGTVPARQKAKLIKEIPPKLLFSQEILPSGKMLNLHWMHNGPGAPTKILGGQAYHEERNSQNNDDQDAFLYRLTDLALRTTRTLGVRFASVDIFELPDDPKGKTLRVLEVNTATMLDHQLDEQKELSEQVEKRIYAKVIRGLFASTSMDIENMVTEAPKVNEYAVPLDTAVVQQKKHGLANIISQIAKQNGWKFTSISQDWVMQLSKDNKVRIIVGYTFPLNNATSSKVCKNKAAASTLLKAAGIPQIRHHLFEHTNSYYYTSKNWLDIHAFAKKHTYDVVCKPLEGTGGVGVDHVRTARELEHAVETIFASGHSASLCAFKKIRAEYRLIILNGEVEIIFRKSPPYVVGDGKSSVRQLVSEHLLKMDLRQKEKLIPNLNEGAYSDEISVQGEKIPLYWKHNLGQGASCELLGGASYRKILGSAEKDEDDLFLSKLIAIAKKTAKVLDVNFVSVDIVDVVNEPKPEKQLRVMEVNSGVMMDNLAEQHGVLGLNLATSLYAKALQYSFNQAW